MIDRSRLRVLWLMWLYPLYKFIASLLALNWAFAILYGILTVVYLASLVVLTRRRDALG
jgi:hypothetical protein